MLILTVIKGPDKGRRFELPDDEPQLIGRSGEALPLHDRTISRRHAEMTPDDGQWYIRDLTSSNGTYVNGQRLTQRWRLQLGDQIRTGNTLFMFGHSPVTKPRHGVRVARSGELEAHVEATVPSNDDSMIMSVPEPSEAAALQLRVLYEMVKLVGSIQNREELLEKVMDVIFEFFQADRGFILLQDSPDERPDPVVVRHRVVPKSKKAHITISRTIVQHVMKRAEGVLSSNAMADQRFSSGESVHELGIRSALCVPIKFKDRIFGVIHVDSQIANYTYTEDQLLLLTAIGVQTGLALANAELYEERLGRERLAAIGQTVASLSHSIKNMLQGLRGGADVVDLGMKKNSLKVVAGGWEIVTRNLERIYNLTMNMLFYSKQRRPEVELMNLPHLLGEVVGLVQRQFDAKGAALITDFEPDMPPVPIDPAGIHQAVLNLLNNGLDAVKQGGVVTLRCEVTGDAAFARIQVADTGEGIPPQNLKHLFEPFYSTKGMRGTGLGLVVAKKVAEEHGGRVEVESSTEGEVRGTTVTMLLPTSVEAVPESADTHSPTAHDTSMPISQGTATPSSAADSATDIVGPRR